MSTYEVDEDRRVPRLLVALLHAREDGLHGGFIIRVGLQGSKMSHTFLLACKSRTYRVEDEMGTLCKAGELVEFLEGANSSFHAEVALEELCAVCVTDEGGDFERRGLRMLKDALQRMTTDVA